MSMYDVCLIQPQIERFKKKRKGHSRLASVLLRTNGNNNVTTNEQQ